MSDFAGSVAIVTGAASGIGAAVARELGSRGARVAVLDRAPANTVDSGLAIVVDITRDDEVRAAVHRIVDEWGGIDVVINNAGIGAVGDVSANDDEEWHRVFDVNVMGIVRVTRAALPWLRASRTPAVVNTCSALAFIGVRDRALYSATKGAVAALTLAMAADYVRDNIRVNAVAPGTADTPWVARLLAAAPDPILAAEALRSRQPIGRLVTPDEIAVAIASLASPRSGSTTGAILPVDGGMTSLRP